MTTFARLFASSLAFAAIAGMTISLASHADQHALPVSKANGNYLTEASQANWTFLPGIYDAPQFKSQSENDSAPGKTDMRAVMTFL